MQIVQTRPEKLTDAFTTETTKTAIQIEEEITDLFSDAEVRKAFPSLEEKYVFLVRYFMWLVWKFFAKDDFLDLASSNLEKLGLDKNKSQESAFEFFDIITSHYLSDEVWNQWKLRLRHLYRGEYPKFSREFWADDRISCEVIRSETSGIKNRATFQNIQIEPASVKKLLSTKIIPIGYQVIEKDEGKADVIATADVERLANKSRDVVPKTSLPNFVVYNRPAYGVVEGWHLVKFGSFDLPTKTITAKLTLDTIDRDLLTKFFSDLETLIPWKASAETIKGVVASYIGYLIQPMLAHLSLGQMPATLFSGPTKSGKGYLSHVIPSWLYNTGYSNAVSLIKMPKSGYEFDVNLNNIKNSIFIVIDEVANSTAEEFKSVDAFTTQSMVNVRKMQYGYFTIPNTFCLGMTAVHKGVSDETAGRLVNIKLGESKPEVIAEFNRKWDSHGPILLSTLFHLIKEIKFDRSNIERVRDRREGFSILSHFVKEIYGHKPNYEIEVTSNDVLDEFCVMHEKQIANQPKLTIQSKYSSRDICLHMNQTYGHGWNRSKAKTAMVTALGYTSTKVHPIYKDTGYPAESKRNYHIEIKEEGTTKRLWYCIKEVVQELEVQP